MENNTLPRAAVISPKNGTYTPADNKVVLELSETKASEFLQRVKTIADVCVTVGGVVLSVTGVATCLAPALFTKRAMAAIQMGSFILSAYSAIG